MYGDSDDRGEGEGERKQEGKQSVHIYIHIQDGRHIFLLRCDKLNRNLFPLSSTSLVEDLVVVVVTQEVD